tara:strand:+ start:273 stop:791 length:519 start_codon:yes stop_codon:yes gene_type:complete
MYTDHHIQQAFERYWQRTERVMEVLRLAPLNRNGIYRVVHSSQDFMIINTIQQADVGGMLAGQVGDVLNVCRELYLQQNPDKPTDCNLLELCAGLPLQLEKVPFFMVCYDQPTLDYVTEQAHQEMEFPSAKVMRTANSVPFYLASETDVNAKIPLRVRIGEDMSISIIDENQ